MNKSNSRFPHDVLMLDRVNPRSNRLVAALPRQTLLQFESLLQPVHMPMGEAVCEAGSPVSWVYFPVTSTISVLSTLSTGAFVQVGLIGCEGVFGRALFMDEENAQTRGIVQTVGTGLRMEASWAKAEFERGGAFTRLTLRYMQALMAEIAQTAVCNRHHGPRQQVCRWLLLALDRIDRDELAATHEFIGHMLGVRRETVTDVMKGLHEEELIATQRGRIRVLDRAGLERCACECYAFLRRNHERLIAEWARLTP